MSRTKFFENKLLTFNACGYSKPMYAKTDTTKTDNESRLEAIKKHFSVMLASAFLITLDGKEIGVINDLDNMIRKHFIGSQIVQSGIFRMIGEHYTFEGNAADFKEW
jgi:hypothetical protein